jgi:Ca2+-binding RTX toxin-like protein
MIIYLGTSGDDLIDAFDPTSFLYEDAEPFIDDLHLGYRGGEGDDTILGGVKNEALMGDDGNDVLDGGDGNDYLDGGAGFDDICGGAGDDMIVLKGYDEIDAIQGGWGYDILDLNEFQGGSLLCDFEGFYWYVLGIEDSKQSIDGIELVLGSSGDDRFTAGAEAMVIYGGLGDDLLIGGPDGDVEGRDCLYGDDGNDTVMIRSGQRTAEADGGEGIDLLDLSLADGQSAKVDLAAGTWNFNAPYASSGTAAGFEQLRGTQLDDWLAGSGLNETIFGNSGADILLGRSGKDCLFGEAGADDLRGGKGNDSLSGGSMADRLTGGEGRDWLSGGSGRDVFIYEQGSDSGPGTASRDLIIDFEAGGKSGAYDRIDLSRIDARPGGGDNAFTFVTGAFTGVGQIRAVSSNNGTLIQLNLSGDKAPEMVIELKGVSAEHISALDFIL